MNRFSVALVLCLLVLITPIVSRAQCSEGAIICETFGHGPTGPLAQGLTNFKYVPQSCPDDGEYNVMDTVAGSCHGEAWHALREDHTPNDVRGNMFVVNASYQPSEFYSQKVAGLCPGVVYEFALWALNLNRILQAGACDEYSLRNPIIAMRIELPDGTLIREVVQPAVSRSANPVWTPLSMQFSIPTSGNDIVVKLVNKGLGGCGNDLVIDDISFRPVHPILSIQFPGSSASETTVCADTRLKLTVGADPGYVNPVYQWQQSQDNVNWTSITNGNQATYVINAVRAGRTYYRLRNTQAINAAAVGSAQCSTVSNVLIVNGRPDSPFSLGDDIPLCQGMTKVLGKKDSWPTGTSFLWSDQSTNATLTIANPGSYWLETNLDGCLYRDTVNVIDQNCRLSDIYVPDAFSPNGDAYNDQFLVFHEGTFTTYSFRVYDRWGSVIFFSQRADIGWDGTYHDRPCLEDIYAWTVDYSVVDQTNKEAHFVRSGRVLLIR